jgi:hypothetical protein
MPICMVDGKVLILNGKVMFGATAADCCCCNSCPPCCPGSEAKTIFLTIDSITFIGAETCDAACVPNLINAPSMGGAGGETPCNLDGGQWFVLNDPGTSEHSVMKCLDGVFAYFSNTIQIRDGLGGGCALVQDGGFPMEGMICDPFYWEGDIPFNVYDLFGGLCGTATVHVIISE